MDNACLLSGTDFVKFENLVWVPNLYEFAADSRVILGETLHGVFSWANKPICMGRCCFVVFMRNTDIHVAYYREKGATGYKQVN